MIENITNQSTPVAEMETLEQAQQAEQAGQPEAKFFRLLADLISQLGKTKFCQILSQLNFTAKEGKLQSLMTEFQNQLAVLKSQSESPAKSESINILIINLLSNLGLNSADQVNFIEALKKLIQPRPLSPNAV